MDATALQAILEQQSRAFTDALSQLSQTTSALNQRLEAQGMALTQAID